MTPLEPIPQEVPKVEAVTPSPITMKELLKLFAHYNIWATQRLTDMIIKLPEEKSLVEVPSSYNSLLKTVLHIWDAESIWWQRMKLQERITRPSEDYTGTISDASLGLISQSKQWEHWVSNASEMSLDHVFQYYTTKKELIKMPVYQMLLHVFNHGTYHRGQLVNILRQLGEEKIPQTDFSLWVSKKYTEPRSPIKSI